MVPPAPDSAHLPSEPASRSGAAVPPAIARGVLSSLGFALIFGAAGWAQTTMFTASASFTLSPPSRMSSQALRDMVVGLDEPSQAPHLVEAFDLGTAWHMTSDWEPLARLSRRVQVVEDPAAHGFRFVVRDDDAERAAALANACVDALQDALDDRAGPTASGRVELRSAAQVPTQPDEGATLAWMAGGALAGAGLHAAGLLARAVGRRRSGATVAGSIAR